MTKKEFWRSASRWGLICGLALFVMSLVSWALKLEQNEKTWTVELLHFIVICPAILFTGFRNARFSGVQGYPSGRAVGYIFAMLMFAGIIYGVVMFLMMNFIARDYYDAIMQTAQGQLEAYRNSPQYDMMVKMMRWQTNPIYLIVAGTLNITVKGGVLGLILAAFFKKNPDLFAATLPAPSCSVSKDE
jgi:uncharacterized membrane-anchored protein